MKKFNLLLVVCCGISISVFSQVPEETARKQFVMLTAAVNSLVSADIDSYRVTGQHVSSISGIHHYYFMQEYHGIGINQAVGSIHFNSKGEPIENHSQFENNIAFRITSTQPQLSAQEAIMEVAHDMKYNFDGNINLKESKNSIDQQHIFLCPSISARDIPARLMYQPMPNGEIRLAWDISILELEERHWWSLRVDALTGLILNVDDWMVSTNFISSIESEKKEVRVIHNSQNSNRSTPTIPSYTVYAMPLQSPADGNRTIEVNPADPTASPFGWHDVNGMIGAEFNYTRGNNVDAYEEGDNPGFSPSGGTTLTFDFPIDTTYSTAIQSEAAAITNLFYWNNVIHDVLYHYGFTESAGNFQENNYGNGGNSGDYMIAKAQSTSFNCNGALTGIAPDGINGIMAIGVCNSRDGVLDNQVVANNYGLALCLRLTGGPSTTTCLNSAERMSFGWADYLSLMTQLQTGDQGSDAVGIGTWLFEQSINGPGVRPHPYSTDLNINPLTYADLPSTSSVQDVGAIWCAMIWELTWALIDQEGFDPDFYFGAGGNNIALQIIIEGMKLQPCNPGFVDTRDAILLAEQNLFNGEYQCLLWEAFAKRGLGVSADQGSSGSKTDGIAAFDLPENLSLKKDVDKLLASGGDTLTYTLTMKNLSICFNKITNSILMDTLPMNVSYILGSASHGGSESGGVVAFPAIDTLFPGESALRTFSVLVDANYMMATEFLDDMESGDANWRLLTPNTENWEINGDNPHSPSANAWFAENVTHERDQFLELDVAVVPNNTNVLSFWHSFNTQTGFDGGVVQYTLDQGETWSDLEPYFIKNGYNSTIDDNASTPAFSGSSNGYIESQINLVSFEGQTLQIRFWMSCDDSQGGDGWYIDDVGWKANFIENTAYAYADDDISIVANLDSSTIIQYAQCMNGIQDGDETGVDCGGASCLPCATCSDMIQNGFETGVDCGGPACDSCACAENDLTLSFMFDDKPKQISWEFKDQDGAILYSDDDYKNSQAGTTVSFDFCVFDGCYELFIYDSGGNGLCCINGTGFYQLINNNDSTILASGAQFGEVDSTYFCLNVPPMSACDSLLAINGNIPAGIYHAADEISSSGRVKSPRIVVFKAGNKINLNQNFEVKLGADFEATIENCASALSSLRQQKAMFIKRKKAGKK